MIVNAQMLRDLDACGPQVDVFVEIFGDGDVEVTEALCVEHAEDFNWKWAGENLLGGSDRYDFDCAVIPIETAYVMARRAAQEDYTSVARQAKARYQLCEAPSWHEFYVYVNDDARKSALEVYEKASRAGWAECVRAMASTFGRLASKKGGETNACDQKG